MPRLKSSSIVSDKVLERIDSLLGHPSVDPHGDPIPPAKGRPKAEPAQEKASPTAKPASRTGLPAFWIRALNSSSLRPLRTGSGRDCRTGKGRENLPIQFGSGHAGARA